MKSQHLIAGVDVSKDTLDVYYNDANGKEHYLKVRNDREGHELLIGKIGVQRTYLMESSGPILFAACLCYQEAQRRR
jgi:transposase